MTTTFQRLLSYTLLVFTIISLTSIAAEASYYTQMYGQNPYSPYPRTTGSARGSYLSFPVYPGSYNENLNRNSYDLSQAFSQQNNQNINNQFSENLINQQFGASFGLSQNLLDIDDFAEASQSGSTFDTGSISYSLGDGTTPTYRRELTGNFRGKRNDFKITETIFGGEKINYNRNFGTNNNYATNAGYNRKALTNNFNAAASLTNNQLTRNTASSLQEQNSLSNELTLQESNFGRGFSVNFNRY